MTDTASMYEGIKIIQCDGLKTPKDVKIKKPSFNNRRIGNFGSQDTSKKAIKKAP